MTVEFIPTQVNIEIVTHAFTQNPHVDLSFDCYLEGTAGRVMVDDAENPTAFRLEQGSFWYYAGDATGAAAKQLMKEMPPYTFLMPSPPEWIELAKSIFGRNLTQNQRFSFSGDDLSKPHLESILELSRFAGELQRIDAAMAQKFIDEKVYLFDIPGFRSATDFYERGLRILPVHPRPGGGGSLFRPGMQQGHRGKHLRGRPSPSAWYCHGAGGTSGAGLPTARLDRALGCRQPGILQAGTKTGLPADRRIYRIFSCLVFSTIHYLPDIKLPEYRLCDTIIILL